MYNSNHWMLLLRRIVQAYWHLTCYLLDSVSLSAYIEARKPIVYFKLPFEKEPDYEDYKHRLHQAMEFTNEDADTIGAKSYGELFSQLMDENLRTDDIQPIGLHDISLFPEDIINSLPLAKSIVHQQMIILIPTFVELMFSEFISDLLLNEPMRMYQFISDDNGKKGMISLKTIINAATKEEMLFLIAEQAAENIQKGSIKEQISRVNKLVKEPNRIPKILENELIQLFEIRNKIVHESLDIRVTNKSVIAAFDLCQKFIYILDVILAKEVGRVEEGGSVDDLLTKFTKHQHLTADEKYPDFDDP